MILSTLRLVLFLSVLFSSLSLITSYICLIGVFVNSDTLYDTNDSPFFTFSPVIFFTSSCEFSVWFSVVPTSGCSMCGMLVVVVCVVC